MQSTKGPELLYQSNRRHSSIDLTKNSLIKLIFNIFSNIFLVLPPFPLEFEHPHSNGRRRHGTFVRKIFQNLSTSSKGRRYFFVVVVTSSALTFDDSFLMLFNLNPNTLVASPGLIQR